MTSQSVVYVIATSLEGTRAALAAGIPLARGSRARLVVLVPQIVPYPVPLDRPVDSPDFVVERYRDLVRDQGLDAEIRVCLCRHADDVLWQALPAKATVVVGGSAGRWRSSHEERLARRLTHLGYQVVFAPIVEISAGAGTRPAADASAFDLRLPLYFVAPFTALLLLGAPTSARAQGPDGQPPDAPVAQTPVAEPSPLDGVTFGIGFDGYYQWNTNRPIGRINLLRAYDVSSNSFSLNQANVIVERAPDVSKGRRMGLRLDLMFGQATETLAGSAANEPRPQVYRNVFQAYGTYIAPLGRGLSINFGKFGSALGIESNYTKDQINYSRSYFFNYLPFYHFGFHLDYPLNDRVTLTYWLVNGQQQSEDFNGFKSQAALVTLKPVPSVSWNLNYYSGREGRDLTPALNPGLPSLPTQAGLSVESLASLDRSRLQIFDTYATWTRRNVTLALEGDYVALAPEAAATNSSIVKGGAAYAQYRVTPQVQLGARYAYFGDRAGLFSGQQQNLQDLSATATWQPADGMMLRAEWRRDASDHAFFLGRTLSDTRKDQQTISLGLVWWFGSKQGAW